MTDKQLRDQISAILVKWHMPTRQAAINEIMEAIAHHTPDVAAVTQLNAGGRRRGDMRLAGPQCSKCGCRIHEPVDEDHVRCVNCGYEWQILTDREKAQLDAFVEKIAKEAGWA